MATIGAAVDNVTLPRAAGAVSADDANCGNVAAETYEVKLGSDPVIQITNAKFVRN